MKTVVEKQTNLGQAFQTYSNQMSSALSATNKRVDGVMQTILDTQDDMHRYFAMNTENLKNLHLFTVQVGRILYNLQSWQTELDNILNACELLVLGKLPSYLVPSSVLQKTLDSIQQELTQRFPGFMLVHTAPAYYYTHTKVIAIRTGDDILFTLRIPITTRQMAFQQFTTRIVPVPLHNDSSHASELQNIPSQVFISQDLQVYALPEAENDDFNPHDGHFHKLITVADADTCLAAIISDSPSKVNELCRYLVFTLPTYADVFVLDYPLVMLSNVLELFC